MPKIFLVEDDRTYQDTLHKHLSGLRGIVDIVVTFEGAISSIDDAIKRKLPYDAYILDTMFPRVPEGLPEYEAPLDLVAELIRRQVSSDRILMVGYMTQTGMQKARDFGLRHFYYKEREKKIEGQKHFTQIRVDLARILRH